MPNGSVIRASEVKTLYVDETYSSKMLIDQTNSQTKNVQINMGIVAPGAKHPDHKHKAEYEEVYLIMKGKAMVRLDCQDEYELTAGDVVFIPGGTMHAIANRSEVWSKHPEEGANPVYDQRIKEWGKSFVKVDEQA